MNDSLNTLYLRDDRPLEPWRVEVLSVIDAIFREQSCPYMLVGATARDLLLFHVHGGPQPSRRTRDIDFGIAVNTWDAFEGVRKVLLNRDSFHASKVQHRLFYRTPTVPEAEIDVIPFGELASADGVILWPPERDRAMSVIGFEEALSAAVLISISDQLIVPVVSLPGLAVLKLFAWSDRKEDRDATDLYRVIRSYADAGNEDRLYDGPLAEEFGFDMELAGAKLLGMDVVALCRPQSLHKLQQIFVPETIETLAHHMLGRSSQTDSLEPQLTQVLETFLALILAVSEPEV